MDKKTLFKLLEITTNIEGNISKKVIDVNIENTIIQAIDTFKFLFPAKAAYITDAQLVSGEGIDDLTIVLLGDEPDNVKKAFKIAFNLLSRNQRYTFSRTPDIIDTILTVQNISTPE
jgi:hypothetical protein